MRSNTLPTLLPLAILLFSSSAHAKKPSTLLNPQIQARQEQSTYVGGWPLALAASQSSGCPAYAPVEVQNKYTTLECCPTGQIAFVDPANFFQYCCPDNHDCGTAVRDFPACANSTWNMFDYGGGDSYFCCEPGQTATTGGGYGLCEPAGVAVPLNMIVSTASQDTVAAAATAATSTTSESAAAAATTSSSVVTAQTTSTALVVVSTDTKVSETTRTATLGSSSGAVVVAPTGTGTGPKFSSSAVGGNSTIVAPSLGPSVTAATMTTVAGGTAGSSSASAPGAASASPSAKTGGSENIRGAVGALGAAVLMAGLLVV